jgi:hypothetical protein
LPTLAGGGSLSLLPASDRLVFTATKDGNGSSYAVLWRRQTAVKAQTRARRIAQLVETLERGETIHIFKPTAKV